MNDPIQEQLEKLHRLKQQVDVAIGMVDSGLMMMTQPAPRTNHFFVGDFAITDRRPTPDSFSCPTCGPKKP